MTYPNLMPPRARRPTLGPDACEAHLAGFSSARRLAGTVAGASSDAAVQEAFAAAGRKEATGRAIVVIAAGTQERYGNHKRVFR